MSNEYPQPVDPMSRAEAILRGDNTVVPMSRIEDLLKQLIEGGGGGSTITITTEYNTGTKVATFDVDGTDIDLYIPTDQIGSIVSITTEYQDGVKIATLTIDQQDYNIYIPADQVGAKTYGGTTDPSANVGDEGDLYFKLHRSETRVEHDFTPTWTQSTWNEVDNPYYENFYGYKGTFSFQSSSSTVTKTEEEIPIYDTTVQNNPGNYKFWSYSAYKWCAIARSADNKKLYFYDAAGNASYTAQKVITSGDIDGYTDQFIKRGNAWLGKNLPTYSTTYEPPGGGMSIKSISCGDTERKPPDTPYIYYRRIVQASLHAYHVAIRRLTDCDGVLDRYLFQMHPQAVERHVIAFAPHVCHRIGEVKRAYRNEDIGRVVDRVEVEVLYRLQVPVNDGAVFLYQIIHHAVTLDDCDVCLGLLADFLLVAIIPDDITEQDCHSEQNEQQCDMS